MCHITHSAGNNLASRHLYGSGDRLGSEFEVIFFFLQTYMPKKSFFTLRLWVGIRSQLLAQVHPCSFFLQINSGANVLPSLLFSCSAAAAAAVSLHSWHTWGHHPYGMQAYWQLWWHRKAHFCRRQHDYGEGEGEVEQMCFNTSFFVFITVP